MGVPRSILKVFTMVLGILNEFSASAAADGVVVLLLIVTGKLSSSQVFCRGCLKFCRSGYTKRIYQALQLGAISDLLKALAILSESTVRRSAFD